MILGVASTVAPASSWEDQIVDGAMPGWEVKGAHPEEWAIADGVLRFSGKPGTGWMGTKRQFADFEIELEYRLQEGGNSGVFLRAPGPDGGHPTSVGMEVQILDDEAEKHKTIKPWQHCGSLYHIVPAATKAYKPVGEWNHLKITADGDYIHVVLNGTPLVTATGQTHPEIVQRQARGFIGLQNHNEPLEFRRIRLRDLAAERYQRSAWFREAKFGMFIHWGVYAERGEGEWVMKVAKIPAAEYEKLLPQFNPVKFDAAEWVDLARRAGQRYMVITSKHHDGFAMYDSNVSDYDIIDATPYSRDPMKALADECRKQGIHFGFYHSILDWHHPDYVPVPEWDKEARAGHTPDFDRYLAYMRAQTRELCTNYGPLACIWWDGGWDHKTPEAIAKFASINAMIRALQPDILINNRANLPEDFATPEQYVPPTGLKRPDGSPLLWENCITLTTGHGSFPPTAWWGYDKNETEYKTPEYCIRMLIDIVSKGGNLLLNVGPTPEGEIQPAERAVLEAIGTWMAVNSEAIYGTRASPFRHLPFYGKVTAKEDTLYCHVFHWPKDRRLELPGLQAQIQRAYLLADRETPLEFTLPEDRKGPVILLPKEAPDSIASVVAVELLCPWRVVPTAIEPDEDGAVTLPALWSEIRGRHGQQARFELAGGEVHVGNWTNAHDFPSWSFESAKAGTYEVALTYAAGARSEGLAYRVSAGQAGDSAASNVGGGNVQAISTGEMFDLPEDAATLKAKVIPTASESSFKTRTIGKLELPKGRCVLVVKSEKHPRGTPLMKLRGVKLIPVRAQSSGQHDGGKVMSSVTIDEGRLHVVFKDNAESPGVLSGIQTLVNTKDAPGFDAFDPDTPGASAGMNFEHIIAGHENPNNAFTPRHGRYEMHAMPDGASVRFVRRAADSPWSVASTFTFTVTPPHYIDFDFRCTAEDASKFDPYGYAIFFFANYMNDVVDPALHFRGTASPDDVEDVTWVAAGAPPGPRDYNGGGTYRHVHAAPLPFADDLSFRLNTWSYDRPRFAEPYYYGLADNGMVYQLMFDRAHGEYDEIRFSLFKFKLERHPRPAWDFQYVVRDIEPDREYGFRGRLIWKKFVSAEDCHDEYMRWQRSCVESTG